MTLWCYSGLLLLKTKFTKNGGAVIFSVRYAVKSLTIPAPICYNSYKTAYQKNTTLNNLSGFNH